MSLYTKLNLIVLLGIAASSISIAEEVPSEAKAIPEDFALFDELVASEAEPEEVYILVERGPGIVRKHKSWFFDFGQLESKGLNSQMAKSGRTWLVASPIRLEKKKPTTTFSFFLADSQSAYAATPMRTIDSRKVVDSRLTENELSEKIVALRKELNIQSVDLVKLGDDLESLKQEASEIAGVEKIVDLKMELTSLQNFNTESDAEQKRLEALIAFGRSQPDEADLAALRKDLGAQLKQTARKTATADRLAARKKLSLIHI